jgi:hypothetical protein
MSADVLMDYYRCSKRSSASLPFDVNEVINNLRLERYVNAHSTQSGLRAVGRELYYRLRPLMGVAFRKHLQRAYLKGWQNISFPHWPVDRTVECILESLVRLVLEARGETEMPFVWFWPRRYSGCVILTHDVETAAGRDFAPQLADIDASFGFKSSFQIVPEDRYEVPDSFLESLRASGSEINLHGLNHGGRLFENRQTFLKEVRKIHSYARQYGSQGFRSPVMYRNLNWYEDLKFAYDMSVPNCAHLDPQRGGCCTVMPYFIGHVLELPLTMAQDYSVFHILRQNSIELWKQQIDLVLEKHGLISFNIHPDYVIKQQYRDLYCRLLDYLAKVCAERNIWIALPYDVNHWWRQRAEMALDAASDDVAIARAEIVSDNLTYNLTGRDACVFA